MGFAVVLAVNIVFVRTALRSNPGVVTEHAYEKGLAYNTVLDEVKTEKSLGWKASISYDDGRLQLSLNNKEGQPMHGAQVKALVDRPLQEGFSKTIALPETGDALYAAPVEFPLPGQWDITASIIWNKHYFQIRQRIMAP